LDNRRFDGASLASVSEITVNARLPILILLLLSLALGPAKFASACGSSTSVHGCHDCCASPDRSCCAASGRSAPQEFPASVAPQSQDANPMVSPALIFIGAGLQPARASVLAPRWQAVSAPGRARLSVTCIRLI